jgi:hypothetical protein
MGVAVTAAKVMSAARGTLLDAAATAWTQQELLDYLNEAMRAGAAVKPDFHSATRNVELVHGTEQALPADGVQVFDVRKNAYSGQVVTLADRELIDETNRFWPTTSFQRDVDNFYVDMRDPTRFTVSPPNDGTGEVEVLFGTLPDEIVIGGIDDVLAVHDKFEPALISYVLHRAYAKNSKRQDLVKSQSYKQQWAADLGMSTQAQSRYAPKTTPQENKP